MLWREGDKPRCFHMKDVYRVDQKRTKGKRDGRLHVTLSPAYGFCFLFAVLFNLNCTRLFFQGCASSLSLAYTSVDLLVLWWLGSVVWGRPAGTSTVADPAGPSRQNNTVGIPGDPAVRSPCTRGI